MAKQHIKIATIVGLIAIVSSGVTALGFAWTAAKKDSLILATSDKVAEMSVEMRGKTEADIERDKVILGLQKDFAYMLAAIKDHKIDLNNHTVLLERILIEVTSSP